MPLAWSQTNSEHRGLHLVGQSTYTNYIYSLFIADTKGFEYRYIEETIEQDHVKFKPLPIVNPFLTDFVTETMEGAGNNDDGTTRAVGAIGSMQGILVAL